MCKFSIIIPTISRKEELIYLLHSIRENIDDKTYEVLIIDQNTNNFISDIIYGFTNDMPIRHFRVDFKGLSKAKNFGALHAKGEWLCFPDDDCKILKNTFSVINKNISTTEVDILYGKCIDENGKDSVMKFKKHNIELNIDNMSGGFVEATAVVRKKVFNRFKFDENMGAGCFHGAEEGYDWLYRVLLEKKYKVLFDPSILFYHPQVIQDKNTQTALKRVFTYRCGFAYLCKKHRLYKKYFTRFILSAILVLFYFPFSLSKSKYYSLEISGLFVGWVIK